MKSRAAIAMGMIAMMACRRGSDDGTDRVRVIPEDTLRAWDSAVAWISPPRRDYLTCSPAVVGADDTLLLRMTRPHGASLHIASPDKTPFIVVFHGAGDRDRGARTSLLMPQAFEQLTELRLPVGTLTAGAWVFGRDTNELVFRVPGTYRVRVGNDMETDGPDYAECLVTYRAARPQIELRP
jgi:hypothetical protein